MTTDAAEAMTPDIADYPAGIRRFAQIPIEARVWDALRRDPDRSIRELQNELGNCKSVISLAIQRLIAAGHVLHEARIGPTGRRRFRYEAIDPLERRST